MTVPILLTPYKSSQLTLKNRVAMAPLTRCRAVNNLVSKLHVEYYRQRAGAGLIISEGSQISPMAVGYPDTPGIHSEAQVEAWKKVTEAVHEMGGKIFLQLWHVGRVSHPVFLGGEVPVGPSAIGTDTMARTKTGKLPRPVPRAMDRDEIKSTVEDFARGAENAVRAGFDGVEIHGANGYLINQFLCDGSNQRQDEYGGSIENRCRFGLEVISAVVERIGAARTAIRLSPGGIGNDMHDSNAAALFGHLITRLNDFDLAFLHLLEPYVDLSHIPNSVREVAKYCRPLYRGTLMINNGFSFESANRVLEEGHADLVSFGKAFISNPDLVRRFEIGAPLASWDESTFYSEGETGYTDYPVYQLKV